MGVRGLQSFLKNNHLHLATRIDLSDSDLVIDANNLLCLLYGISLKSQNNLRDRDDIHGGDLVSYGKTVRQFFTNLDKCSIKPILVFDGSVIGKAVFKDYKAPKEKESFNRGETKFKRSQTFDEFSPGDDFILPQTINIAFRNIAVEMGVRKIQTPYEADAHIARLANELNCPVLTNDSDFIIYDLKKGFIMIDHFEFKEPQVGHRPGSLPSIGCRLFSQAKLTNALPGLQKETMPLLSVLLGNDYVDSGTFELLLKTICGKIFGGVFEAKSFNHRRINALLIWLMGRSLQDAINYILRLVQPGQRAKLEEIIKLFMENYRIEKVDDFDPELEQIFPSKKDQPDEMPVAFLRRHMEKFSLGSIALDIIFGNTHYSYSIIDDITLPTSSLSKFRAYSLALALLRRKTRDPIFCNIYDRKDNLYSLFIIKPMEHLDNFGSLNQVDCYSMISMKPERKKEMLMSCFLFNNDEMSLMRETVSRALSGPFVDEAALCFILVKYMGVVSKLAPCRQFVNALMLTLFYYAALTGQLNKTEFEHEDNYGDLLLKLGSYVEFNRSGGLAQRNPSMYRRIMHYLSQLHCSYKGFCLINSLLDHVFQTPRTEKFLNSALIFRLTKLFRMRELKIEKLCIEVPVLSDLCDSIQDQVLCAAA